VIQIGPLSSPVLISRLGNILKTETWS
jgi:hypothetical protein